MIACRKLVLESIGIYLLLALFLHHLYGKSFPLFGIPEKREENGYMHKSVHLHKTPVGRHIVMPQPPSMLIKRQEDAAKKLIREILIENIDDIRPVGTHSYAALNCSPAVRLSS